MTLLGPRQVGKTTLALAIADAVPSIYLDLEDPADRDKLADPALYLRAPDDKLVVLDEIQNAPNLFSILRGLIDQGRRKGRTAGRFLLLGSASIDLLRQSSESLAGRKPATRLDPTRPLAPTSAVPLRATATSPAGRGIWSRRNDMCEFDSPAPWHSYSCDSLV